MVIDDHVAAVDGHLGPDLEGAVLDPVVLHVVFKDVAAVRDLFDFGPHAPFRVVHQRLHVLMEGIEALLACKVDHAPLAEVDGRDQRAEVAVVVARRAHVREHQAPDIVDILAGALDFHGRHSQALVEDLGGLAGEARGRHAADLADMTDGDRETQQIAVEEDGLEEGVFGRVQTAAIGVVVDYDIALDQIIDRDFLHAGTDQQRHAADHRRAEITGRDQFAVRQREATGEIERFRKYRRIGRSHQRHAHVPADGNQDAADDVE